MQNDQCFTPVPRGVNFRVETVLLPSLLRLGAV
jgi:hypothetical protein